MLDCIHQSEVSALKEKTKKKKPKYNMWQNTGFMIACAWHSWKPVMTENVLWVVFTVAKSIAELLAAPIFLGKLEASAPLGELFGAIALVTFVLIAASAVVGWLEEGTQYSRIEVRVSIIRMICHKLATTSYPNMLDADFLAMSQKANEATQNNDSAAEKIWSTLTSLTANILCFVVYLFLLTGLPLWMIVMVGVTATISYLVSKRIHEWGYRHREEEMSYYKRLDYMEKVMTEREYAKDVRIFGLRAWLVDLWDGTMRLYGAFVKKREGRYIWANVLDLVLTFARNGIAYAYLLHITLTQGLPASQFLLYFTALSGFTQWVNGILEQFSTLHRESLELSTMREFLDWKEPFRFEDGEKLDCDTKRAHELRLENVSFCYQGAEKDTLSHIDLTVHPGEKLAVVGLNGAGKTTLVKLLCGFLDPTEGTVRFDGEDIRKYNRCDYYRMFSAVFQDFSVLEAPLLENVTQSMENADEDRVWQCLEQAGLTQKVRSLPKQLQTPIGREVYEDGVELSGGQTQRLMLARALYKDAPVLILDEPTAALDPIAEHEIYQKYSEMSCGKTSIFISHRLASTRFCDRILFLADGKIAEEGTHEELLHLGGGYAELFEVQSQYYRNHPVKGEKDDA